MSNDSKIQKRIQELKKIDEMIDAATPKKIEVESKSIDLQIGFFRLFRFAKADDRMKMILGSIAAIINGACIPLFGILYGEVRDALVKSLENQKSPNKEIGNISLYFLVLGGICFACGYIQQYCWSIAGTNQAITIRKQYYNSLLNQDIIWYQQEDKLKLAARIQQELFLITDAIADKVGFLLMTFSLCISGILQGFFTHFLLTLILVLSLPLIIFPFVFYEATQQKMENLKREIFSKAGKIFDFTISQIQLVKSYNYQESLQFQYEQEIEEGRVGSIKFGLKLGISLGLTYFMVFFQNGICFLAGSFLLEFKLRNLGRPTNLSDIIIVFYGILLSGLALGQINPFINMIARARFAGGKVFSAIDGMQTINCYDSSKKEIPDLKGHFEGKDVSFKYITKDQEYQSISRASFQFLPKQKISLIGQSGSGKSSLINLLMRFYDPQTGSIYLDGHNLKSLNIQWLRSQIGYLGEEPEVFYGSIKDNLLIAKSDATDEELFNVLDQVYLKFLVQNLSNNLEADVKQLSGGEKQRLCLARVILKKPKIYILDEPTSQQDYIIEKQMQKVIDEITKDCTTIIISHSFQNIKNSDQVLILHKGNIIQRGDHETLMKEKGLYLNLIEEQQTLDENINNRIKETTNNQALQYKQCHELLQDPQPQSNTENHDNDIKVNFKEENNCEPFGLESSRNNNHNDKNNNNNNQIQIESDQNIQNLKLFLKSQISNTQIFMDLDCQSQNLPKEEFIFNYDPALKSQNSNMTSQQIMRKEENTQQPGSQKTNLLPVVNYLLPYQDGDEVKIFKQIIAQKLGKLGCFWNYIGLFMCIVNGIMYPANSIVIANTIFALTNFTMNSNDANRTLIYENIAYFFYISIASLFSATIQSYAFTTAGETVSAHLKRMLFQKVIILPTKWFSQSKNKFGGLSEIQSVDIQKVSNALSVKLSFQIQNASSLISAIGISLIYNVYLSFIIIVLCPIMAIAGRYIRNKSLSIFGQKEANQEKANEFFANAINNHKTIASFQSGHEFLKRSFSSIFDEELRSLKKKSMKASLAYGLAMFIIITSQSLFFLVVSFLNFDKYNIRDLFVCIFSILFAIFSIIGNLRYLSDFGGASSSLKRIIHLLFKYKSEDEIHTEIKQAYQDNIKYNQTKQQNQNHKENEIIINQEDKYLNNCCLLRVKQSNRPKKEQVQEGEEEEHLCTIEFKRVSFKYPYRENYSLFDVSFKVMKGEKASIIGPSGSGKSTILNLIQGFYENYTGKILVNDTDIRLMDLNLLRETLRWIPQESFILNDSLLENVTFGKNKLPFSLNRYKQSLAVSCSEDILQKMRKQYLEEFKFIRMKSLRNEEANISELKKFKYIAPNQNNPKPQLYSRVQVEDIETMRLKKENDFIEQTMKYQLEELSGGQKQKICLSRAIYGQGDIYLFDNATFAMDLKTEKKVYSNLKSKYFNRKTVLQITQRLEPICYGSKIMILSCGRLIEIKKKDDNNIQKE